MQEHSLRTNLTNFSDNYPRSETFQNRIRLFLHPPLRRRPVQKSSEVFPLATQGETLPNNIQTNLSMRKILRL